MWRLAMHAALLPPGDPQTLRQQLLAAAVLNLMGHCKLRGGAALLAEYQKAAIALTVSLEAQVGIPHLTALRLCACQAVQKKTLLYQYILPQAPSPSPSPPHTPTHKIYLHLNLNDIATGTPFEPECCCH